MAVLAAEHKGRAQTEATGPTVLARLRAATRSRHERLDSALPLAGLAPSLDDYAVHLRVIAAWRACIAPWVARAGLDGQAALDAALAADLADCAAMGTVPAPAGADGGFDALAATDDGSAAFAWGVAYVLEGSMLGGMALHRTLSRPLAPHPLRYLAGRGEGTAAHWREFLHRLEQGAAADAGAAAAGACAAFDTLTGAFRRAGVV